MFDVQVSTQEFVFPSVDHAIRALRKVSCAPGGDIC